MSTFTGNTVASGNIIYASDHNTLVTAIAAVVNGNIDSTNIAAGSIGTTQLADLSVTNAKLGSGLGDAYTSRTPTFTGFTLGNGTLVAAYKKIGKTVFERGYVILGTTSSMTGNLTMTLQSTAVSALFPSSQEMPIGTCRFIDAGVAGYPGSVRTYSTTQAVFTPSTASGSYVTDSTISATVPLAWGTGDVFAWAFSYEEA